MNSRQKSSGSIYRDKNFYIANSVMLVAIIGGTPIAPILPTLAKNFNVSLQEIDLVLTAFFAPSAFIAPIFGVLADRLGRKQVLIPSLLLFAIAGGCSAFVQDFNVFLGLRFLQGIGAASLEVLSLTLLGDLYTRKMLTIAMGFNASMIGISSALYPALGGALGGFSWQYPVLLSVTAFPIAMLSVMVLKLPNKQRSNQNNNLQNYLKNTWKSVSNRSVLGLFLVVGSFFIIQIGAFIAYIPKLAEVSHGASGLISGILLGISSISAAFVASQLGFFARQLSEIKLIKIACIISAVALLIIPTVNNVWLLLIPNLLFGASFGMALPPTRALLAGLAAQDTRGGFMAVNATFQSLGQTFGPILAGIAFGLWGMHGVFWTAAGFSLVTLVLFNFLLTPKREIASPVVQSATAINNSTPQATKIRANSASAETQVVRPSITPPGKQVYSPAPQIADHSASEETQIVRPSTTPPGKKVYSSSPTVLQIKIARLIHQLTNEIIELPNNIPLIHLGKPDRYITPNVDLSLFPNSKVVSRKHAVIRIEGNHYYIQDLGSSNGTYLNRYPLLPGNWYKLRSGDRLGFGKGDLVTFIWQIATS